MGPVASATVPAPHRIPVRRRARTALVGVLALAASAGVLAGCGADAPSHRELSDALVDSGLPRKVSDCVADAVLKSLTPDEVEQLMTRGSGGAPVDDPKRTDDSADKLRDAMARCRTLQADSTTTTTTEASTVTTPTTVAPSSVPAGDGAEFNTSTP